MSPVMAHRVISLQSSVSVAFGEKRTSSGGQDRLAQSRMTHCRQQVFAWRRPEVGGALKVPRLTRPGRLDSPLLRWLIGKRTAPAYHELLWRIQTRDSPPHDAARVAPGAARSAWGGSQT